MTSMLQAFCLRSLIEVWSYFGLSNTSDWSIPQHPHSVLVWNKNTNHCLGLKMPSQWHLNCWGTHKKKPSADYLNKKCNLSTIVQQWYKVTNLLLLLRDTTKGIQINIKHFKTNEAVVKIFIWFKCIFFQYRATPTIELSSIGFNVHTIQQMRQYFFAILKVCLK